jgi:hypothetical protein
VVGTRVHERRDAADGRDLDDVTATLLAQERQRGLSHPEGPEHVRFQLSADLGLADLFDHAELPVARVVHHDIQPPEPLMRLPDRGERRRPVGDVQLDRQDRVTVLGDQIVQRAKIPCRRRDLVATVQGRDRPLTAEAPRRTGDKPRLHVACTALDSHSVLPFHASSLTELSNWTTRGLVLSMNYCW